MNFRTYKAPIETLAAGEVFVFGGNEAGFHGAGSAGYASFHVFGNQWRRFAYDQKPDGWQGYWNVKGALGLQEGAHGKSYALVTVTRPGARRSLCPDFDLLYDCCREHADWVFYLAQAGKTGLNGWSPEEMAAFMCPPQTQTLPPENLWLEESFAPFVERTYALRENAPSK